MAAFLGLGLTMTAETVIELLEYPVVFGSTAKASAYYDTIADLGMTLFGAVLGALTAWWPKRSLGGK